METLKIKDLMVNDIVLAEAIFYDNDTGEERHEWHPLRITATFNRMLLVNFVDSIGNWLDDCEAEEIGDIKPMPLTKEALKANDFKALEAPQKDFYKWSLQRYDVPFSICKTVGNQQYMRFGGYYLCDALYVHQLQHALRICELNDLANNLKIE